MQPNYCELSACSHGATCLNRDGGFSCLCPAGYGGDLCTDVIDACATNPCLNGGRCVAEGAGQSSCRCPAFFGGVDCSLPRNPCSLDPCNSNGLCSLTDFTDQGFVCACFAGFTGPLCDVATRSACSTQPCSNNGRCLPVGSRLSCPVATLRFHFGIADSHFQGCNVYT